MTKFYKIVYKDLRTGKRFSWMAPDTVWIEYVPSQWVQSEHGPLFVYDRGFLPTSSSEVWECEVENPRCPLWIIEGTELENPFQVSTFWAGYGDHVHRAADGVIVCDRVKLIRLVRKGEWL